MRSLELEAHLLKWVRDGFIWDRKKLEWAWCQDIKTALSCSALLYWIKQKLAINDIKTTLGPGFVKQHSIAMRLLQVLSRDTWVVVAAVAVTRKMNVQENVSLQTWVELITVAFTSWVIALTTCQLANNSNTEEECTSFSLWKAAVELTVRRAVAFCAVIRPWRY